MANTDCGFCVLLANCDAQISNAWDFYTFAAKMLCEIADNTGAFGPSEDVNVAEVGGVAVTIADFQDQNLVKIAGETLGASFYDQALQAIQVSVVNDGALNAVNLTEIAGETLGASFYDQTLQAIQVTPVGIQLGAGASTATTQRIAIATDANAVSATGNVASDAVDAGNPVKIGYQARTSDITAVSNADRVDGVADKIGRQVTAPYAIPENALRGTTADITDTTSTQVIAAQAGGVKIYITDITVSNMSGSVATRVDLLDGNGGAVLWQGPAAAAGGGYTKTFNTPIAGTAATRLDAKCATTGAQVQVSVAGYKGV